MLIHVVIIMLIMLMSQCGWYWGSLSFDDTEEHLCDLADGSFLVRDSSDERYILSLSFRSQSSTHHTRIEHYKGRPTATATSRSTLSILDCVCQKRSPAIARKSRPYRLRPKPSI